MIIIIIVCLSYPAAFPHNDYSGMLGCTYLFGIDICVSNLICINVIQREGEGQWDGGKEQRRGKEGGRERDDYAVIIIMPEL